MSASKLRWVFLRLASALAVVLAVSTARAQGAGAPADRPRTEPSADAKATAQRLFESAVRLHEALVFKEACPLFAESLRLDFGIGTLLYLSDCQEQIGATASAWAGFKEAQELATRNKQLDRAQIAGDRAAKLEPKLSMFKVDVAPENKAIGVVVKRNGVVIGEPVWGTFVPVDPGPQTIEAEAKDHKTWTATVEVPLGAGKTEAIVPPLGRLIGGPAAAAPEPGGSSTGFAMRIAGISLAGVGVLGIALGTGFGIDALVTFDAAEATCVNGDPNRCTPEGVEMQRSADDSALISTVGFSIGATALVGGALLFFLAPEDDAPPASAPPPPQVGVSFDSRGAFVTLTGKF